MCSFSWALSSVRVGVAVRRAAWKPNKVLIYKPTEGRVLQHLALQYDDGSEVPWIPVQCDMLQDDWDFGDPIPEDEG